MMPAVELIGFAATALAVSGCLLNNRRVRWCFVLWGVSNLISFAIHAHAGIVSLAVRDIAFTVLAAEGWFRWRTQNHYKFLHKEPDVQKTKHPGVSGSADV